MGHGGHINKKGGKLMLMRAAEGGDGQKHYKN